MDFRLLGPIEVRDGDRAVRLGGAKERALLALLLLRANRVVPRDRLVDELWGERPPRTAVGTLQTYVSHLRDALGPDALVTRAPGYVLVAGDDEVDLRRFERLVERGAAALREGAPREAAETLRAALGLWRGPALADVAGELFAAAEVARLEELRTAALELRLEADLALGRHLELVAELEALVREHPLRERLRGLLMLALYRSGRQADALEVYRAARAALDEELGIAPSEELRELERAVLRHDPELDAPPARRAAGPIRTVLVVGQGEEALTGLLRLAAPLGAGGARELLLVRLLGRGTDPAAGLRGLTGPRDTLLARGTPARVAAFTSDDPAEDVVRLASSPEVELALIEAPPGLFARPFAADVAAVLGRVPCDVGYVVDRDPGVDRGAERPVVVPFGGAEHDWAALELGARLASGSGAGLVLAGTDELGDGRRDASRLLASASLIVQRVTGVVAEPRLVDGAAGVAAAAADAAALVAGVSERWRAEGLGPARQALVSQARPPVVLVRRGVRPGGLAPPATLTRFSWTLGDRLT